jgi:hypothetical protein
MTAPVQLVFLGEVSFVPGSREDNDHGEPPRDGSWALALASWWAP